MWISNDLGMCSVLPEYVALPSDIRTFFQLPLSKLGSNDVIMGKLHHARQDLEPRCGNDSLDRSHNHPDR